MHFALKCVNLRHACSLKTSSFYSYMPAERRYKAYLSSDLIEVPRLRLLFDLLLPDEALVSSDLAGVRLGCDVLTGTTGCILAAVCWSCAGLSDPNRWLIAAAGSNGRVLAKARYSKTVKGMLSLGTAEGSYASN